MLKLASFTILCGLMKLSTIAAALGSRLENGAPDTEISGVAGIEIAGPLPVEVQSVTLFSCGVCAQASNEAGARDFIRYLASPEADAFKRRQGMEPA